MRLLAASVLLFALSPPVLAANDHYRDGDLISVHWDSSYDYDDLQAMPATREVFDAYPDLNYLTINGAKSNENSGILKGSSDIMRMVFPDGLDAYNNNSNSRHTAADRWQETLQSGGTVHVAEGGPSDFTADVVRELISRNVGNLKNIRVIQHANWNVSHTDASNLSLIKNRTTYLMIANGNSNNDSAQLRTNGNDAAGFRNLTSSSRYSHVWDIAFQAVTNADRFVDFSDVVEVLYILDVPKSRVGNAFDFGNVYFGQSPSAPSVPSVPVTPTPVEPETPSTPSVPTASDSSRVAVFGSSLAAARNAFAEATSLGRVDCDPVAGGYVCASFRNPTMNDVGSSETPSEPAVPVQPSEPSQPSVPADPAPALPVVDSDRVAVYASSLSAARAAYAAATSLRRVDCDPSGSGYICASFRDPTLADIQPLAAPVQPSVPATPSVPVTPDVPASPAVPVDSSGRVAVYGNSLSQARANYAAATNLPRVDCDEAGSGYVCASFKNPVMADVNAVADTPAPSVPVEPAVPATPSTAAGVIRIEVEDYTLGAGWARDTNRSGYSGAGYIRWTGANRYYLSEAGQGIMSFAVKPASSGLYTVRLRSRALNPAASDKSNDVWMRVDGSAWLKVYNAGKDEWRVGGTADSNHNHFLLKKNLVAGNTHVVEISGRSTGFAIDYIELVKN